MDNEKDYLKQMELEFTKDTKTIANQTEEFLKLVYPAYLVDRNTMEELLDKDSTGQLASMTYFRICCCTIDTVDKVFEHVHAKMEKLFTALHAVNIPVGYGLISGNGTTNLVLGIYSGRDVENVRQIMQGMLAGIEIKPYNPEFADEEISKTKKTYQRSCGILSGVPTLCLNEEKQTFSLSSVMRSLNGKEYTLLFLAKPVPAETVRENLTKLIKVKDTAFAVSKRSVARTKSYAETVSHAQNVNDSEKPMDAILVSVGAGIVGVAGGVAGSLLGGPLGAAVGGAIGGGLGGLIANVVDRGRVHSEGYSDSISNAVTDGGTISGDIQNSFALELMNYADKAIVRMKSGQNNGIWQTAVVYSADSEDSRNMIKACLCAELSKPDPDKLPLRAFEPECRGNELIRIPDFLRERHQDNALCSYINSSELGLMCTFPTESVPDFELRIAKSFPLVRSTGCSRPVMVGNVADGKTVLNHMPFSLDLSDLNKHTFVCGITGSGKTTTVKKILVESKMPFLVIESAKKEYRNLAVNPEVYTLGKPEMHCPQMNPFYIMPGVSPQIHIDYLKDLFQASFSFYGPMPYILEKCMHTVYKNKGWDLTLGYHPMLAKKDSAVDFFDINYAKEQYKLASHKYLFPTMQDLKEEVTRYIEEDLKYDGEVAGNVKTAMKVQMENLCVGAKGFAFNTCEHPDFSELFEGKAVFELEGLADDCDKAFSVGLLVIFINEYRQIEKEISGTRKQELKHLLVIEEAHRLLKNIETEKTSETEGNPKGKAVELFTDMIAEMRSYGQGVIVAEQIPTKLAPDVIKNTATKIVQRIVSADDQRTVANAIGIAANDAIQLGTIEAGYALCHKEGMFLPTAVKISNRYMDENDTEKDLDAFVSDEALYNRYHLNDNRFDRINFNIVCTVLNEDERTKLRGNALLNTLLTEKDEYCIKSCKTVIRELLSILVQKGTLLAGSCDRKLLVVHYLTGLLTDKLLRGIYCVKALPADGFISALAEFLSDPTSETVERLKEELKKQYGREPAEVAKGIIIGLIQRSRKADTDIRKTVYGYFIEVSKPTVEEIEINVEEGGLL